MMDYSDMNVRQLYELLLENITKQLNGIDSSDKVKSIKQEADKRDSKLYKNAFDEAIRQYNPPIKTNIEDTTPRHILTLQEELKKTSLRIAQVSGISMVNKNISEGNYVMYDTKKIPYDGSVVIANYKGQTFIKNYYNRDGKIILESSNKEFSDIEIDSPADFKLNGVVIMLLNEI